MKVEFQYQFSLPFPGISALVPENAEPNINTAIRKIKITAAPLPAFLNKLVAARHTIYA
jgi:hypothetical protein